MRPVGNEVIDPLYYERYGYPHASWTYLRQHEPVSWFEPSGFKPFWAITKYDDIKSISTDFRRFQIRQRVAVALEEQVDVSNPPFKTLLNMDPPEHGKYRRLMSQQFSWQGLEKKRTAIGRIVDETFDQLAERGEVDFVEKVAAIIPLAVICEMLGLPRQDWDMLFRLSNALIGAGDPEYQQGTTAMETLYGAVQEFFQYFGKLSELRRRDPQDDFITTLANADVDGQPIAEWELLSYYVILIIGGNETTRNATSGGLLALIEHPDEFAKLRRNPALLPQAVEEILRWVSPIVQFARTAIEDVEIRDARIRAGESVCLFYPSANRDEDVFSDPFTFRLDRELKEHYAFGIGVHHCLGANLARLQLQEIFRRVISRFSEVEMAGPVGRLRSSFVGGIKRMPIRYRLDARVT
jgi:cholest-4-en-3-one 26-monooxygenase